MIGGNIFVIESEPIQDHLSRKELIRNLPSSKKNGLFKHWEHNNPLKFRGNSTKKKKKKKKKR